MLTYLCNKALYLY